MRYAILFFFATVAAAQPRIDSITPSQGPIAGGTIVTIAGAGLSGAAVNVDGVVVVPLAQSDGQIRLAMPKHDNGYALISAGSAVAEFLYVAPRLADLPAGYITTVAGVGKYLRLEQPATRSMVMPWGLALAANGDIYFAQAQPGYVLRVRADGTLQRVAGRIGAADFQFLGDGGPALDAFIGFPRDVARDAAGNLYVNDTARFRIRKIDAASGIITTIAGTGAHGFSGDGGPATSALLGDPSHLTCAPDGTIYFLDDNLRVRRIAADGTITTIAGNGTTGDSGDGGPALQAQLNPGVDDDGDLAVDADGNVFVVETAGRRVRRIDAATGVITTFASRDSRNQVFGKARSIATDGSGNVYVGSSFDIVKFDRGGRMLDFWGNGQHGFVEDGAIAKQAPTGDLQAIAVTPNGDIIFSDETCSRMRKIDIASGKIVTLAGMGPNVIGVPGPASGAVLDSAFGDIAFLPSGDLIDAAGQSGWIFRIDSLGNLTPFAGSGLFQGGSDGVPALGANIHAVGLDVDAAGDVFFVDKLALYAIDAGGMVRRVAGKGGGSPCDIAGDGGQARDALLCQPGDVTLDRAGNLFIADTNNNRIRRVDALTGIITTVAGSGPSNGFEGYAHGSSCGDGAAATSACLNTPVAVAVLADGTIYVNDFYNNPKIRKVVPDGTISTINTPQPMKMIVGPGQSVFVNGGNRIFRLDHDRVRIIAGNSGTFGFAGDGGPAIDAQFAPAEAELAYGLAIDAEGNLFVQDGGNRRLRAIRYGAVLAPPNATIAASANGSTITAAVLDAAGHTAPGVRVDFAAPATGASCGAPFAITDANGIATTTCTPNCVAGTYSVVAKPLTAAATASVSFTNDGHCHHRPARH